MTLKTLKKLTCYRCIDFFPEVLLGFIGLFAVGLIFYGLGQAYNLLGPMLFWSATVAILLLTPIAVLVGHMLAQQANGRLYECNCGYTYSNIVTEFLHKRKCLTFLVKNG